MFGLLRQEPNSTLGSSLSVVDSDDKPLRRVRACTACRNRKLKCSLARPQCSRCEAQKITCHYPETGDGSKKSTTDAAPSSTCTDDASLKRKRVKKTHTPTSQSKPKSSSSHHNAATKKERSKSVESSTLSHQLSLHPLPSPISPTATTEDNDDHADEATVGHSNIDDGSWINQLLMYTNGEGLEPYIGNTDVIDMPSQWLGFDQDASMLSSKASQRQPSHTPRAVQCLDSAISPIDETPESMDLDHYFTDSPDMLLESPAYSDLGFPGFPLNGVNPFHGGVDGGPQGWAWEGQQDTDLFSTLAQSSLDPAIDLAVSLSQTSTSPSSVWSRSSTDRETNTTASSPSHVLFPDPTENTAPITTAPATGGKRSIKTRIEFSNQTSSHKSLQPKPKVSRPKLTRSSSPYGTTQAKLKGTVECYPSHVQPLLKAFEKLQVSSFNFLQATTASRNKKNKHRADKAKSPPYDTLLKSQKQALSACAVLLDCSKCSAHSELVMLVVSVCSLLVGSLDGLDRSMNGKTGTAKHGDMRMMDSAEAGYYPGDGTGDGFTSENCDGAMTMMMDEHDEEDTAQIIRTLTASRIAKLRGILEMVVKAARRAEQRGVEQGLAAADWSAHVGLATLLQGKLRRYS
ncbi:hypothetical protein QBC37DRAFT_425548 [Rhypophila decipiens]|uniref:Zn(2)-C6 fungal-type domain-containing protein n=1 Tax=Rhypophila decipiens TaxID=261697 RepID=A0AAN6Y6C2_9PEZI|nr:hypothetical protein QBC37DRAFT_425548 [Rhypophila decipiens]